MTSETNLQNKLEKLIGTENFEIKNVTFFDDGGYLYTNMKMIEKKIVKFIICVLIN